MRYRLIHADVLDGLRDLADESVQCVVTSPPYWGLRDYGVVGQSGLERTPEEYVARKVAEFRELHRVLRSDGTLWLNIGDSYAGSGKGGNPPDSPFQKQATNAGSTFLVGQTARDAALTNVSRRLTSALPGIKAKDLVGIPWMLAFALRASGWYLRSDIIWAKPNPMPESVTDRPTKAHEYLFLLTRSARYYYDADAIRDPAQDIGRYTKMPDGWATHDGGHGSFHRDGMPRAEQMADGRNKRSVWTIATEPYPEAHFATFPTALVKPCILAGSKVGDTILDPFSGSGTTGVVALSHQRNYVGIELNADYVAMSRRRLSSVAPMFAQEVTA